MTKGMILIGTVFILGCAVKTDSIVSVGMPFASAHYALRSAGAELIILQNETEDETHVFHDCQLPDGTHLHVKVTKADRIVSQLVLQKDPDPRHGKTLGPEELVKNQFE